MTIQTQETQAETFDRLYYTWLNTPPKEDEEAFLALQAFAMKQSLAFEELNQLIAGNHEISN